MTAFQIACLQAARAGLFGHGSRDPVFAIDKQEGFYREIRKRAPGYPVQFRRFESGNHGTPIRMSDWREMLNWILASR